MIQTRIFYLFFQKFLGLLVWSKRKTHNPNPTWTSRLRRDGAGTPAPCRRAPRWTCWTWRRDSPCPRPPGGASGEGPGRPAGPGWWRPPTSRAAHGASPASLAAACSPGLEGGISASIGWERAGIKSTVRHRKIVRNWRTGSTNTSISTYLYWHMTGY